MFRLYDNVVGTSFLTQIEKAIKEMDFKKIFLLTDRNVPAYNFSEEIC